MSQLSALMVHIFGFWWAYFFGFFVFVVYFHITVFSGVGRKFCSIWPSCQTCQSKSLISGLIIPNIPCFFFEMSECRQGLSFFLSFFCLQSFVGHIFALKSPERILFIAVQSKPWRGESFFLTDLYMCDHLFDLCSCWHAYVKANILLRCLWAECRAALCLPKQSSLLSS